MPVKHVVNRSRGKVNSSSHNVNLKSTSNLNSYNLANSRDKSSIRSKNSHHQSSNPSKSDNRHKLSHSKGSRQSDATSESSSKHGAQPASSKEDCQDWFKAIENLKAMAQAQNESANLIRDISFTFENSAEENVAEICKTLENYCSQALSLYNKQHKLIIEAQESLTAYTMKMDEKSEAQEEPKKKRLKTGANTDASSDHNSSGRTRRLRTDSSSSSSTAAHEKLSNISPGAQVAYRTPVDSDAGGEWIQCVVLKVLKDGSGMKYQVQDTEPDELGAQPQTYVAIPNDIILLPSSSDTPVPFTAGSRVLARYPETTTFYPATFKGMLSTLTCNLVFDGDGGNETKVNFFLVLPFRE